MGAAPDESPPFDIFRSSCLLHQSIHISDTICKVIVGQKCPSLLEHSVLFSEKRGLFFGKNSALFLKKGPSFSR